LSNSGGRALAQIIGKFKNLKNINYNIYTKLYNTCVWPILDYCSGIWHFENHECANKIQNRAIRYFLGIHRNTTIIAFQGDMGWLIPKYRYYLSTLRLWNRIISLPEHSLTRQIFEHSISNFNDKSWEGKTFKIFEELNITNLFLEAKPVDLKQIEPILFDILNEEWQKLIPLKPKLRTYSIIKNIFETEPYVSLNLPKYKRSVFAQIRMGILPLEIEVGRYYRKCYEERLCKICNISIEDEIHFVCDCKPLEEIRNKYLNILNVKAENSLDLFCNVINHSNIRISVNFIYDMWQKRLSILNHCSNI
jgi:hypothetical protein